MRRLFLLSLLALPLIACDVLTGTTDGDPTDTPTDEPTDSPTPTAAFAPDEGTWTFGPANFAPNACNLDDNDIPNGFVLTANNDGTWTVDTTVPNVPVWTDCSLTGMTMTCAAAAADTDFSGQGFDAVMTNTISIDGSFTSETEGSAAAVQTLSCVGTQCTEAGAAVGAPFPCTSEYTMTVTWVQ